MLLNRAESHTSAARFLGIFVEQDSLTEIKPIFPSRILKRTFLFFDFDITLVATAYAIIDFLEIQPGAKNPNRLKTNVKKARTGANVT